MYNLPEKLKQYLVDNYQLIFGEFGQVLNFFKLSTVSIKIKFEDGSKVKFNYAWFVVYSEGNKVYFVVLTEHCGYYIISADGAKLIIK